MILKCKITNKTIQKEKNFIIRHLVQNFMEDEQTLESFLKLYNGFIEDLGLNIEEYAIMPCSYRQDFHRTGIGTELIWKPGGKFRHYIIANYNYSDFFERLNLKKENGIYNALEVFENNKELMQSYDIRDGYELHNILRRLYKDYIAFKNVPFFELV